MLLSILDVLPVLTGSTAADALGRAGDPARLADRCGFHRLWFAEHHGMGGIASSTPELLIAHVAPLTGRIRVGAGGIMLPNHTPLQVVERYQTLEALHPGRIDLGIGRAAGTDPLTAQALRSASGEDVGSLMAELLAFARGDFPAGHPFARIGVTPGGVPLPPIWMLGSSGGSARLAGGADARAEGWLPDKPRGPMAQLLIAGTPDRVREGIESAAREAGADELMVMTIIHDLAARLRSYELLARAFSEVE